MATNSWYMVPSSRLEVPPTHGVPNQVIDSLLGQGLDAADWQRQLELLHYTWRPILRSSMIRRELWYFKNEIEQLIALPNTNTGPGPKSNSCRSILLKIQGKTGEREQRLRIKRLCGPEILCRTLENHVKEWKTQKAPAAMVFDVPASMDTYTGHFNLTTVPFVPENNHSFIDFPAPAGLTNPSIDSISQPASYAMVSSPSKTSQLHLKDSGHGSCPLMSYQSHNTFDAATNNMTFDDGLVTGSFLGATASDVDLSRSSLTTFYKPQVRLKTMAPAILAKAVLWRSYILKFVTAMRAFPLSPDKGRMSFAILVTISFFVLNSSIQILKAETFLLLALRIEEKDYV